jgi:simple sugar transport system substrate-binding protein
MDAMDAAGVTYGVGNDVILISWDAVKAALQMVLDGKINSDFCCYPLQGPTLAATIQKLEAGETVPEKTFMVEPWYVAEDVLKSITYTNSIGEEVTEDLIQVTEDIVANQPY